MVSMVIVQPTLVIAGHHIAVTVVSNFAPRGRHIRAVGKKDAMDGGKFDAYADAGFSLRQLAANEEFVIAKAAVGGLNFVRRARELQLRIGVDAGVRAGGVPDSGGLP